MEFVFELFFQLFLEFVLQFLFEVLAEVGVRSAGDTFRRQKHPILSTIGYTIWGAIAGGLSLLIFPHSAISDPTLRGINLLVTPFAIGLAMAAIGKSRSRRGQFLVRLDTFNYAFVFAFTMALIRYLWAA